MIKLFDYSCVPADVFNLTPKEKDFIWSKVKEAGIKVELDTTDEIHVIKVNCEEIKESGLYNDDYPSFFFVALYREIFVNKTRNYIFDNVEKDISLFREKVV